MPIQTYQNWNKRPSDQKEQIEPYRKYIIICEGANTETFYFRKLIDLRKELGIHPLIDIRLWEKTDKDRDISYPEHLFEFAERQKDLPENGFDRSHDKMIIVFDGDIFENKVKGYDTLLGKIEKYDIAAVTNPNFELFLILHFSNGYEKYIKDHECEFFKKHSDDKHDHAYLVLLELSGMNAKSNPNIGVLAKDVSTAIVQEKYINQDIHRIKGRVSSNIGSIIESIIKETPEDV